MKTLPAIGDNKKEEGRERTRLSSSGLRCSGQSGWAVHNDIAITRITTPRISISVSNWEVTTSSRLQQEWDYQRVG